MAIKFRPKLDKIVELLLYLAHKKPGTDKYHAVKFFYLADREHLIRHGRPISFETYFALPYGPVASNVADLMEGDQYTMRQAKLQELPFHITVVPRKGVNKEDLYILGEPKRDVDFDLFSRSDLRVFDEVLDKFGDYDFDGLFKLTHDHEAWYKAWDKRPPNSKRAPMLYEEMIEDLEKRKIFVEEIGPVAAHM